MNKHILVDFAKGVDTVCRNLHGDLTYLNYKLKYPPEFKKKVAENKRFKNLHSGQRCFILGNGPSLKAQDISPLKDEVVFVVNQAARNPQIRELAPTYHFWLDPVFFNLSSEKEEDMEVLETYSALYTDTNRPITFMPQQAFRFVKESKLDVKIDICYFVNKIRVGKEFSKEFDFSKVIPCFGTVVHCCIAMALYMGFKEIYLLGIDSTGIITIINSALDSSEGEYAYDVSYNERKRMHNQYSDPEFLKASIIGFGDLLDTYGKFYRYGKKHGSEIINCSSKTIVTALPRKRLEDVLQY